MRPHTLLLALLAVPLAAQQRPLTVDEFLQLDRPGEPQVSPDGKWVAYTVNATSLADNRRQTDLLLSFLGDRVYPIDSIFFYFNPALWFFGLLLQLYLVFPLLFRLMQKVGAARFLILCAAATLLTRFLLMGVLPVSGLYLQGFFGSRLWEFAFGMVLGAFARQQTIVFEKTLFARVTILGSIIAYGLGLGCYFIPGTYIFTDPLIGSSLFIVLAQLPIWSTVLRRLAKVVTYVGFHSYGLYLLHQPYVLYFGTRMRELSMVSFVALAWVVIAAITVMSIFLEKGVNQLTDRLLAGTSSSRCWLPMQFPSDGGRTSFTNSVSDSLKLSMLLHSRSIW